jgi:hypothetical protein
LFPALPLQLFLQFYSISFTPNDFVRKLKEIDYLECEDISDFSSENGNKSRPNIAGSTTYYFLNSSMEKFEEKLEKMQRSVGILSKNYLPVNYSEKSSVFRNLICDKMLEVRTQGFYHLKEYNERKRIKCEIRRILIILIVKYSSTQSESIWISRKLQKWEGVENVCRGLSRTVTKRILKGKMGLVSLRVSDNCLLFV